MRLSKKENYLLFALLVTFSIFLRSGYIHQHGGDTWVSFLRADIISQEGAATWILHPLSYFGVYPYSYPTGEHLLLSSISQLTRLDVGSVIFISSSFFGIFGLFSVYLLIKCFTKNELTAFAAIFIFSTFNFVVSKTWNNASTRGLFMVFYPLSFALMLKAYKEKQHRLPYSVLAVFAIIALSSIHRIFYLFFGIILLPFLLYVVGNYLWNKKRIDISHKKISYILFGSIFFIFILQIMGYTIFDYSSTIERPQYFKKLLPNDNPLFLTFNLGATYGTLYGITAILIPTGVIALVLSKKRNSDERILIGSSVLSLLFILDTQYFSIFFPPISAILAAYGLIIIFEIFNKQKVAITISFTAVIILISLQFIEYYIEKGVMIPLFISLAAICVLIYTTNVKNPKNIPRIFYVLVGIMLLSTSYIITLTVYDSVTEYEWYHKGTGKIVNETRHYNRGVWVGEYAQGKSFIEGAGVGNPISAISGVIPTGFTYDIADNDALKMSLQTDFNFSLIFKTKRYFLESDSPDRYEPRVIARLILRGDTHLAKMYKVNFFILPHKVQLYRDGVPRNLKMIPFVEENRYMLFQDDDARIYHYGYFK